MRKIPSPPPKPEARTSIQYTYFDGLLFVGVILSGGFLVWLIFLK